MASESPIISKYRIIIGFAIIATLTFAAPTLLKVLGPTNLNILKWLIISPLVMLPLCMVYFLVERWRRNDVEGAGVFALCLFFWAFAGLGVAVIGVVVWTIATGNPQGPLTILFLGPVGFGIGAVVGTGMWRLFNAGG